MAMRPVHPGELLREDVLKPLQMSARQFAALLDVPTNRVTQILNERRAITADTALRIARLLGSTPEYWLRLQVRYDLQTQANLTGKEIARRVRPIKAA
ncbi:MAG TPA: HigA family addiction module antitoxin [Candidatus Baltobacteraceae bacterium]|nr:HigA family addiction module antitoxin [Candidatus Baltobacteraceae bacterium]